MTARTAEEVVREHITRGSHTRQFDDGFPEPATPEYEAMPYAERLTLAELRAGVVRSGEAFALRGRDPYREFGDFG